MKSWNITVKEDKTVCTYSEQNQTLTVSEAGLYRIVANVSGAVAAGTDGISIVEGGVAIHHSMADVGTGCFITSHLHELVDLPKGGSFQIGQSFSGNSPANAVDNSLFIEPANPKICRYTARNVQPSGVKIFEIVSENKDWVTISGDGQTFTVISEGFYRIVIKVNGQSDVALYVDGNMVARAMAAGLSNVNRRNYNIAVHLNEMIHLRPNQFLQVCQPFAGSLGAAFNSLYIEKV